MHIADNYLRHNPNISPNFLTIIYAISLEISIKLNEQMILSLEDVVTLFEGRFTLQMLQELERHIFMINRYKVNCATTLDFLLHFVYAQRGIWEDTTGDQPSIIPDRLVDLCLPMLHFCQSNYSISRSKYSLIAIAAVCSAIEDL